MMWSSLYVATVSNTPDSSVFTDTKVFLGILVPTMTLLTLSFTVCVLPWVYYFNKLGSTNALKLGSIASFSGSGKFFLWLYRPTLPSASGLLYLHQDVLPYGHNPCSGFLSEDPLLQKIAHTACRISSAFLFERE